MLRAYSEAHAPGNSIDPSAPLGAKQFLDAISTTAGDDERFLANLLDQAICLRLLDQFAPPGSDREAFLDALDERHGAAIGVCLRQLICQFKGVSSLVYDDAHFESDWQRYLRMIPTCHEGKARARQLFEDIRPELSRREFNEAFFERLDDLRVSGRKVNALHYPLMDRFWEGPIYYPNTSKVAVGDLQRARKATEQKAKAPILAKAGAAEMFITVKPEETVTLFDLCVRELNDPASKETKIQFAIDYLVSAGPAGRQAVEDFRASRSQAKE